MPEIVLNDIEAQVGQEILAYLKSYKIESSEFKNKVSNAIIKFKNHISFELIEKERFIFIFIYCLGQYLSNLSKAVALEYQLELDRCIDNKTFLKNPFIETWKTNHFIPENWNELWGLSL